jgi:hypothetical protein
MLRRTILGTLAAGTVTGSAMFLYQVVHQFAVAEWLQNGQPSLPAMGAMFAVVLIGVGGADLARLFVRVAARS